MGRIYVSQFENVAISAIQDIFSLKAGASNGIILHYINLGALAQTSATEFRLRLKRAPVTVTQGSGGTAPTMNKIQSINSVAATATAHANDTTQTTSSGTMQTLMAFTWDVLLPWEFLPAPEDRPDCQVSEALILDLPAAPGASTNCSGSIVWEEVP